MEHRLAANLLSDYARGALLPKRSREIENHVASCEECRRTLEAISALGEAAFREGAAVFGEHPRRRVLERFGLGDAALSTAEADRIRQHVQNCAVCDKLARAARTDLESVPPTSGLLDALRRFFLLAPSWRFAGPALAVVTLALLFPAYRGLVLYPGQHDAARRAQERVAELENRELALAQSLQQAQGQIANLGEGSGFARLLTLTGPQRGPSGVVPRVSIPPAQSFQPVFIACSPAMLNQANSAERLEVALHRSGESQTVWNLAAEGSALIDPVNRGITLLVPSRVLTQGMYSVQVARLEDHRVLFESEFEVAAAPR